MGIFEYTFMQNAFMTALFASVACGIIGTYVVARRLAFISGGIAHAAFGGIGLGYLLGIPPVYTLTPFSLIIAIVIGLMSKRFKANEDSTIGIFWAFGMALGILFIGMSNQYAPDLMGYLFGNILAVPFIDVILIGILDLIIFILVFFFYKGFLAVAFDEEYAKTQGLPTLFLYLLLLCLISLTIVILIRVVGIILVIALLTIPATIARQFTHSLKKMMALSTLLSLIFCFSGLFSSYYFDLPAGAIIILLGSAVYFLTLFYQSMRRKRLV